MEKCETTIINSITKRMPEKDMLSWGIFVIGVFVLGCFAQSLLVK